MSSNEYFYVHGLPGRTADTDEDYVAFTAPVALKADVIERTFEDPEYAAQIEDALFFQPELVLYRLTPVGLLSQAYEAKEVQE